MATYINSLATGTIVLVSIKGGAQLLSDVGMTALKTLGCSSWPSLGEARVNFALIGKKGTTSAVYNFQYRYAGPVLV